MSGALRSGTVFYVAYRKLGGRPDVASPMRSHVRLLLTACLLTVGAVVSPLGLGVALARPTADFNWAPKPVVAETSVTFTSTSTPFDSLTPIVNTRWEFNGDRRFDATSPDGTATVTAPAPASGE